MRDLKIRFIEIGEPVIEYKIQRKGFFGWYTLEYIVGTCGGSVWYEYRSKDKKELLNTVIKEKLETTKEFVRVIEYPTIKSY